jgi:PAS domain S-box-containing protein
MSTPVREAGNKRILIVDDDSDFSAAIGEILDSEGYTVKLAHSAQEACEQAECFDAHVALLDIRLGRDNGIELITRLKSLRSDILCVMMTGHAALDTAIHALQQGAYNYLRKPIDGLDLLSTLERCFEKILLQEDKMVAESALSQRNQELEALTVRLRNMVESTRRLTASKRLDGLMPVVLDEIIAVIGARLGAFHLFQDGGAMAAWYSDDRGRTHNWELVYGAGPLVERLTQTRQPVVVVSTSNLACPISTLWRTLPASSLLFLPFFGETAQLSGIVCLERDDSSPFTPQDRELGALLTSVCSEILRSVQASEALARSEERYRLLADNIADIIWTLDTGEQLTYVSPSVEALRGYTVHEAMSQRLDEQMSSESVRAVRALLSEAVAFPGRFSGEHTRNLELDFLHRNGSLMVTETGFIVLRDDSGVTSGLLAVSRDISERKRSEEARSRLAAAVEHAAESIMITAPDGTIQYVNPAFETLTGYGRSEALGLTPRMLRSGRMDDAFYKHLWATLNDGRVWQGRFINMTKAGHLVEQEATISPILDDRNNIINFVSVARDVTHEVELEAQLRQAQKMEAIGTLAGGIAHDFNNMLSPILGYAELALSEVEQGSELWYSLNEIFNAGKRASGLVKQILAFSRRSEQERKLVQLDGIVKECMQLLRGSLPTTITIRLDLQDCPPVIADPTQMHQVVMNLGTNAYHAMREEGGVLSVRLQLAEVTLDSPLLLADLPQGNYVQLSISDTGLGMSEETMERIFEPYFTTKKVGEGTGLGLATVHGIVKGHKGHILVNSRPAHGTEFNIFIPIATPGDVQNRDAAPRNRAWHGTERVLLVDDEPAIVAMLTRGLQSMGYQVEGHTDSMKALSVFTTNPDSFDILISDQTMPRLTGLELARHVLQLRPDFPIILATGFSDTVNEHSAREAGVRQFLLKPASPRTIAEHIRRILRDARR